MSKHTPAPWDFEPDSHDNGGPFYRITPIGAEVPSSWNNKAEDERAYADARLMHAAPDFLAAAEWVVQAYEDDWRLGEAIDALRAAIAKATGETP